MIEVNLLPGSERSGAEAESSEGAPSGGRTRVDLLGTVLLAAALAIPSGVVFLWWTQRSEAETLRVRLEGASADSTRLAGLRLASDSLAERYREIRTRAALVEQLDRNRFVWPHLLDEISRALPRLVWLISLRQLSPPPDLAVELRGVAANPLAITEFVRSLGASDYIADVGILGSQKQGFELDDAPRQAFTLLLRFADAPAARRVEPIIATRGGSP